MEIKRIGSQASNKGPADWFTGTVRIDPLFQPNAPARTAAAMVTFEPGVANGMAHASTWTNTYRNCRVRLGTKRRRPY